MNLTIDLFGAFRAYSAGAPLNLNVPPGITVSEVKKRIGEALLSRHSGFDRHSLVAESALADEKQVLAEDDVVTRDVSLALLPPVCGG
ncbi:MAG: hypothetical protein J0L97_06440 [Alphaproteobacteria bacterium]|nr:hypothetical protein [Alphaproteobacteria bacterium]